MQQPSPSYRESYQAATVAEAARILGVSESTVRRLVRTGKLEAERVERPQGHAWLVKVPAPATDQSGTSHHLGATTPINQPGSGAIAAWVSSVLDPLVIELRLSRETIAEQAERLGYVAAERDAARAELAAERAAKSTPAASGAPETGDVPREPPIPLSRLLTRWLVLALVLVGVLSTVVALVVWPR